MLKIFLLVKTAKLINKLIKYIVGNDLRVVPINTIVREGFSLPQGTYKL
jgi:hypothetical protein